MIVHKTMFEHNKFTNHISISYAQLEAILKGDITGFDICHPCGKQLRIIEVSPKTTELFKSYGTHFLLDYTKVEEA